MEVQFTKEELKKALEQAEANLELEEVIIEEDIKDNKCPKVIKLGVNNDK